MITKSYALLVGVSQVPMGSAAQLTNKYLPGAKYDVDRLETLLTKTASPNYPDIEKLIYANASWRNFRDSLANKISDSNNQESFLFIHYTGHSFKNSLDENILCFSDRDVHEDEFINTLATIPNTFKTFVCLNACFSEGIFKNTNALSKGGPIGFLSSSSINGYAIASPRADSLTYFMRYFIDTWKNFNELNFNYYEFTKILENKTKSRVTPIFQEFNDLNNHFFNTTVPLLYNKPSSLTNTAIDPILTLSTNSNNYIQLDISEPRNNYCILDSFTVNVNDRINSAYLTALINDLGAITNADPTQNWDNAEFIGVVLIRTGEGSTELPYPVNYLYNDDESKPSNGIVVLINTENNFQIIAKGRTKGKVSNVIGGKSN